MQLYVSKYSDEMKFGIGLIMSQMWSEKMLDLS